MPSNSQIHAYARLEGNQVAEYPIWEGDLKLITNYDPTQGDFEPPGGYVIVYDVIPPESPTDPRQTLVENSPELVDGSWIRSWEVRDLTSEELEIKAGFVAEKIRGQRNRLLADTDWTQLPDSPVNASIWAAYRQELRNIPSQPNFPWEVEWPALPT